MSDRYLFTFAAKGLQRYIMRGGKLRDMVGATSLVDTLSDETQLQKLLESEAFGVKDKFEILQAAAGGARIRFSDKSAAGKVARLWPLWCHAWAPELDVVQELKEWKPHTPYGEVSKDASEALERNRNFPAPRMPEAGPFVKRAPRTGEPAVPATKDLLGDDAFIDLASKRKRAERAALRDAAKLPPVAEAFGFENAEQMPSDFAQISGPEKAYLAVVHADGNRLGQMFLDLGRALAETAPSDLDDADAVALFKCLSQVVVANGTRAAAARATKALRPKIAEAITKNKEKNRDNPEAWPFAPIVLAGDDVTVVCRADLGLPFTEAFLRTFKEEMTTRLDWLRNDNFPSEEKGSERYTGYRGLWAKLTKLPKVRAAIPNSLSAGAGVVFCTDHYPFSLAYELCESLAKHAKGTAKARVKDKENSGTPPSALSFVRITGASAPTDFDELLKGILKGADGALLTGNPYFLDGGENPQFTDLREVYEAARPQTDLEDRKQGLPGSALRGLLNLQRTEADPDRVREAVTRMKEVAGGLERKGKPRREAWEAFEKAWQKLCRWNSPPEGGVRQSDWLGLRFFDGAHQASPLLDLLTLLAVRDKAADNEPTNQQGTATNSNLSTGKPA